MVLCKLCLLCFICYFDGTLFQISWRFLKKKRINYKVCTGFESEPRHEKPCLQGLATR